MLGHCSFPYNERLVALGLVVGNLLGVFEGGARRPWLAHVCFGVVSLVPPLSGRNPRRERPGVFSIMAERLEGAISFPQYWLNFVPPLHPWVTCGSIVGVIPGSVNVGANSDLSSPVRAFRWTFVLSRLACRMLYC